MPRYHVRTVATEFTVVEEAGVRFLQGTPDDEFFRKPDDASLLIERCWAGKTRAAVLYPSNMTANFFDLSSGEAGAILQKLRNYRIRLAVVCPPGSVRFSSRFGEMMTEERKHGYFGVFESEMAAREWLTAN